MSDPAVMNGVLRHLRRTERRRLYHLLGDRELLARFLADRDEAAFEEVVTRHGPMVRAVCRRILGPSADADDAFQAAFLVLLRRARSIRKADLLAGWLCAVAYRTARQALRRRSRVGARERLVDELPEPARPDDPPKDWLPLFDAALQRLPAKYRDPVVLCELQGLSRRDASVRLGLTEGTLSSRLGRARDLLRRRLAPYGFPLAAGSALAPVVVPEALTASTAAAAAHVSAVSVTAVVLTEGVLTAMLASKLKAGALAGTAVLVLGVVAGLQLTGPASGAGGPPGKDGPAAKEAARSASPTKPDPKPARLAADYEPFQGEWAVTAAERDGSAQPPNGVGVDENWTFAGNTLTTGGEAKGDGNVTFALDSRTKPPTIDFTLTQFAPDGTGALVRTPYQGVYKFESDGRLVICYRRKADNVLRPIRFATAHNSGAVVVSLRRPEVAPDRPLAVDFGVPDGGKILTPLIKADPAKDADLGKVVGAWELTDVDGQSPDAVVGKLDAKPHPTGGQRSRQRWEALRRLQLLPATGPADLENRAGAQSFVAYVELDGTRNPKWFTLSATEETRDAPPGGTVAYSRRAIRLCGIYKLDGEKLVVCLPEAEGPPLLRPTDFAGDGEGGVYLLTYQRAAKTWKPDARVAPKPVPSPALDMPPGANIPPVGPEIPGPAPFAAPPVGIGPMPIGVNLPAGPATGLPVPVGVTGPPPGGAPPALDSFPLPTASADRPPPNDLLPPQVQTPTAPAPPASDLERLQGVWLQTMVGGQAVTGGEPVQELEFVKDRVLTGGKHGRVRIAESKTPRQITVTIGDDPPLSGIYKLEGDRLTIARSSKSSKLLPLDFEPDADVKVQVYERPKQSGTTPKDNSKVDAPPKAPARDLQKEIDQLREHIQRLEKELKEKKPEGPGTRG